MPAGFDEACGILMTRGRPTPETTKQWCSVAIATVNGTRIYDGRDGVPFSLYWVIRESDLAEQNFDQAKTYSRNPWA
jgi:hypothetical protein